MQEGYLPSREGNRVGWQVAFVPCCPCGGGAVGQGHYEKGGELATKEEVLRTWVCTPVVTLLGRPPEICEIGLIVQQPMGQSTTLLYRGATRESKEVLQEEERTATPRVAPLPTTPGTAEVKPGCTLQLAYTLWALTGTSDECGTFVL